MNSHFDTVRAIEWQDNALKLLDQRRLPHEQITHTYHDAPAVAQAIHDMVVRGAPAIGIAGAYGAVLSARRHWQRSRTEWEQPWRDDVELLANSRPTAVNLRWALNRMLACDVSKGDPVDRLLSEAQAIHAEDYAANRRMGELALPYFTGKSSVITHCNTGSLATAGYGTALGVIRSAYAAGNIERVFAGETRPWLQGARLTAWELAQDGIPVCLMADGAGASRMAQGGISWVIVGADRITADGSVANKIGTYSLAVNARYHGVRFMVVAPFSTVDMSLASGADIPIEQRSPDEVLSLGGQRIAAVGAEAWNPSFDITPASLVDVIVTEKGVVEAPTTERMAAIFA